MPGRRPRRVGTPRSGWSVGLHRAVGVRSLAVVGSYHARVRPPRRGVTPSSRRRAVETCDAMDDATTGVTSRRLTTARLARLNRARLRRAFAPTPASHGYATTDRGCGCATAFIARSYPARRLSRRRDETRRRNKKSLGRSHHERRTSGVHALLIIRSSSMTYATIDRWDDRETSRR